MPDDRLRILLCWLFSLAPGSYECFVALTPGTYVVFCRLVLLLLESLLVTLAVSVAFRARGRDSEGVCVLVLTAFAS